MSVNQPDIDKIIIRETLNKWEKFYFPIYRFFNRLRPIIVYNQLKYGILNLIIWFPIIWNDRQWDHYYLLRMFEKKLKLMSKYHKTEHAGNFVGQRFTAAKIEASRIYITRILESEDIISDRGEEQFETNSRLFARIFPRYVRSWWD